MKTRNRFLLMLLFVFAANTISAQEGNVPTVSADRKVNSLIARTIGDVRVAKGDSLNVVWPDKNQMGFNVKDSCVYLSGMSDFDVTMTDLSYLIVSGTGDVTAPNCFHGKNLCVIKSGVGDLRLDLDFDNVYVRASGSGDVKLTGRCNVLMADLNGICEVESNEMEKNIVLAEVKGKVEADFGRVEDVMLLYKGYGAEVKGTAGYEIRLSEPVGFGKTEDRWDVNGLEENKLKENSRIQLKEAFPFFSHCQTLTMKHFEGDALEKIADGYKKDGWEYGSGSSSSSHDLFGFEDSFGSEKKRNNRRMRVEWSGFEAGLNMLVDSEDHDVYTGQQDLMALRPLRSWYFGFNIADIGLAFDRNHTVGMFTGVGLGWNNYSWRNHIEMTVEGDALVNTLLPEDPERKVKKSKLGVLYLQVPLMMKVNARNVFIDLGVTGGLRLAAWTKIKYDNRQKTTLYDNFTMNLFKLDASLRVGNNDMGFFVNYALTPVFKDFDARKARPLSVGFSLNF